MYLNNFEVLTKCLLNYLHRYSNTADREDLQRWLDSTSETIIQLENIVQLQNLSRAEKQKHQTCIVQCLYIRQQLQSLLEIRGGDLQARERESAKVTWDEFESAFKCRIRSSVISNVGHLDIVTFMRDAKALFISKISEILNEHPSVKVNVDLAAEYIIKKDNEEVSDVKYFNTENGAIYQSTNLDEWFDSNINHSIQQQMESFEGRGSGWSLSRVLRLSVNINKLNQLRAKSYIPLPSQILKKEACINIQNYDDECFKWAVLSALHPIQKNPQRISHYRPHENELNFDGIDFPVTLKDINKFERQNSISINVYMLKKYGSSLKVSPCHLTNHKEEKHVNLLILQDRYKDEDEEEEGNDDGNLQYHYVWIKDLSRLVKSQMTKHKRRCYICDRCMCFFSTEEKLTRHEVDCATMNKCKINLPSEKDKYVKFKNFNHQERVPYVIYADFECLLKPVVDDVRAFQEHQAHSMGFYLSCNHDTSLSKYESYRQSDDSQQSPAEWFIERLQDLSLQIEEISKNPQPMNLTPQQQQKFDKSRICHICKMEIKAQDVKVRDHCHLTGRYRGAAHQICNINYQDSYIVPVIYHNLNYDLHFLIKELTTSTKLEGRVNLLAENKEKYISFTKNVKANSVNFRFIDSYRFMPSSLEKLASYLVEQNITRSEFDKDAYHPNQVNLLLRKGVYPYDHTNSFESLEEKELPQKEDFYNKLNDSNISDEDYSHARNVWNTFKIDTLGSYSDLYLKTDVLLLADVFENFRSTCMQSYGLDPAHYYTTPGLSWDAMLKYTRVNLELITDIDMLMFVERGIRGGISQCSHRYAKANNRYMGEKYDPSEEESYLIYLDANNLYGWSMSAYLPTGGFKWIENFENIQSIPDDLSIGYLFEVDLEYPDNIHDDHQDLPLCPEHMTPPGSKQHKLLTTLYNKERYVLHYRALKQALQYGVVLKKVHRVLQFDQSPWLKPYVDLNTEKRKQSKNEFEKMFFKLLINAVYGKTMENERKRVDVKLVHKWLGRYSAEALIARPNFHSRSIFDENLVAIQLTRTEIKIRKPIYVGLCVLDISKTHMYDFHYSFMKAKLGDKCKMLYTDTDSLIYHIKGENIYDVIKDNIDRFDTSDYRDDNEYGIERKNKKVIGLFKDECNGSIMEEFIGLRSKMYCIRIQGEDSVKKIKGVKTRVVKNKICFDDYKNCLFDQSVVRVNQNNIRSRLHTVRTERQEKIALSPKDDKRYLVPNETDTLPWGHWSIMNEELFEEFDDVMIDVMEDVMVEIVDNADGAGGGGGGRDMRVYKNHEPVAELIQSIDEPQEKRRRVH